MKTIDFVRLLHHVAANADFEKPENIRVNDTTLDYTLGEGVQFTFSVKPSLRTDGTISGATIAFSSLSSKKDGTRTDSIRTYFADCEGYIPVNVKTQLLDDVNRHLKSLYIAAKSANITYEQSMLASNQLMFRLSKLRSWNSTPHSDMAYVDRHGNFSIIGHVNNHQVDVKSDSTGYAYLTIWCVDEKQIGALLSLLKRMKPRSAKVRRKTC